ncbi:hypothetical protein EVAR_45450_1 [Eumeta japonica]|uniref:Uncharacterized protein n=1 Tax=Eumeta variegata TaxID=151549 RepID=A0A4C1YJL9_EUMVA|nr:hypothetical protein EVAR_45450_1 [Eumeta japonica]
MRQSQLFTYGLIAQEPATARPSLFYKAESFSMHVPNTETDGEGDIDDDEAIDWSNSDEENENIDDNDEN